MAYKSYSNTNRKLSKIYDQLKNTRNTILNKSNEDILLSFFKNNMQSVFVLDDTGWQVKKPEVSGVKTVNQGDYIPEILSMDYDNIIETPPAFLPFIDMITFIKPTPNSILTTYAQYTAAIWSGTTIRITTDGDVVYQGAPIISMQAFSLDQLEENFVPLANTKKLYNVVFRFTNAGDDRRVTGQLLYLNVVSPAGTGCSGDPDHQWDSFRIRAYEGDVSSEGIAKKEEFDNFGRFLELGTAAVEATGNNVEVRSVSGGGGCETQVTENPDTTLTVPIFPADGRTFLLIDGFVEIFEDGNWVPDSPAIGAFRFEVTAANNPVFDSVEFLGYVPHYTSDTDGRIQMTDNALDYHLNVYPQASHVIALDRNPDNFPTTKLVTKDILVQGSGGNPVNKSVVFFKLGSSQGIDTYKVKGRIGATLLSRALVDDEDTPYVRTQVDLYAQTDDEYSRISNVATLKTNGTFVPSREDCYYRILLVIKNPFVFQELRKYDTTQ